jgi:hypothetical protein
MSKRKFGFEVAPNGKSGCGSAWLKAVALVPIVLAMTFGSSPASADTLNPLTLTGESFSETCLNGGNPCTTVNDVRFANSFAGTEFGSAQNAANLGQITSVSAQGQASPPPGGSTTNPNFVTVNGGNVTLNYQFQILGPQNILIPISTMATMSITVGGTLTASDFYNSEAQLTITGDGKTLVNQDIQLKNTDKPQTVSVSIDQTDLLVTNLAYNVSMVVGAQADIAFSTGDINMTGLSASASIDPSFQLGSGAPSGYSIVFSDGIGDTPSATPLPPTLPLFAAGLGFVGYLTRRKKRAQALAT